MKKPKARQLLYVEFPSYVSPHEIVRHGPFDSLDDARENIIECQLTERAVVVRYTGRIVTP